METGSGMGPSLNIAVNKNAITLTDRATWISFNNKKNHTVLVEGDKDLYNYYGIIPINPKKCPKTKIQSSEKFINWFSLYNLVPKGMVLKMFLGDKSFFSKNFHLPSDIKSKKKIKANA